MKLTLVRVEGSAEDLKEAALLLSTGFGLVESFTKLHDKVGRRRSHHKTV